MAKVILRGTGQLNGPVVIDKTIQIDNSQIGDLTGQDRYESVRSILQIHYPGVEIDPSQIALQIIP